MDKRGRNYFVLIPEGPPTPGSDIPIDRVSLGLEIYRHLRRYHDEDTKIIVSGHFLNDKVTEYVKGRLTKYGVSDPENVIINQTEPRFTEQDILYTSHRIGKRDRVFVADSHYRKPRFERDLELMEGELNNFFTFGQTYEWSTKTILGLHAREKVLTLIGEPFTLFMYRGSGAEAYNRRYKVYKALSRVPIVNKLTGLSDIFGD